MRLRAINLREKIHCVRGVAREHIWLTTMIGIPAGNVDIPNGRAGNPGM
jgi:hypothetical protein